MSTIDTLRPADRALLVDRFGIDVSLLTAAQIQRLTHQQARELAGVVYRSDHLEGIWFPSIDPDSGQIRGGRVRRDAPELEPDGTPKAKYVAPPQRHVFYFPPGCRASLSDQSVTVVFVESEKAALTLTAAASRGGRRWLPIGLGGCWGWRGVIGKSTDANGTRVDVKGPLPDLNRVEWLGRAAVILFDANASANVSVQRARVGLAQELTRRGAHVRLGELPTESDVNGPDDYRAAHGDAALLTLIDRARPAAVPPPKRSKADTQGRTLALEDPTPWPTAVDGAGLLTAVAALVTKYVVLPPQASTAIALWILHAFAHDAWFLSPILAITSPVMRCGKSVLLIVLGALTPRRVYASHITTAGLFRTIEKFKPTLLVDEADTFLNGQQDELRGVLNSGHTRSTAVVIRPVGEDHEPRMFSTWCAKVIALIGKLPPTLADRAIEVSMRRRLASEAVARLRQDAIEAEGADLRRQAARWAADHQAALKQADPMVPAALHDRAADCWRPLLALADAAGGPWPAEARAAAVALSGPALDDLDLSTELLQDIHAILDESGHVDQVEDLAGDGTTFGVIKTETLLARLHDLADRPWPTFGKTEKGLSSHMLARLLKPFRIASVGPLTFPDGSRKRGYRTDAFSEAFERYLPFKACKCDSTNKTGPEVANAKCADPESLHTLKSSVSSIKPGSKHACTLWEGGVDAPARERSEL
jgi:Protein of unknown function (DUF3631)/Domain of unknown function (DUF3854)